MDSGQLTMYPNPTDGELVIDYKDAINRVSTGIEIFDMMGRAVGTHPCGRPNNDGETITIDISHLPAGMYYLRIGDRVAKFVRR